MDSPGINSEIDTTGCETFTRLTAEGGNALQLNFLSLVDTNLFDALFRELFRPPNAKLP